MHHTEIIRTHHALLFEDYIHIKHLNVWLWCYVVGTHTNQDQMYGVSLQV